MRGLLEHYGFEINPSGFLICPFHDEDTASMKVYNDSYYCFGCGAGGDAVSFTARLFHLKNSQAAMKINADFRLGLGGGVYAPRAGSEYLREQAEKKRRLEEYRREYDEKSDEFRTLFYAVRTESDPWKKAEMQSRLEYLDYWFSQNESR